MPVLLTGTKDDAARRVAETSTFHIFVPSHFPRNTPLVNNSKWNLAEHFVLSGCSLAGFLTMSLVRLISSQ